ncbi:MAG: uroporphyrinogen-III synthase [Cyanobacteria bacterium J06626_4]
MVRSPRQTSPITVLVTRAAAHSSQFAELLLAVGMEVIEMPALEICPPSSWQPLDEAICHLKHYDWLVLTSANAVAFFFERFEEIGHRADLGALKLAVVGKKTATVLKSHNLKPDFVPSNFVADALATDFPEPVAGQKFLFPRVENGGREILVQLMVAAGATVTEVPAYESRCPKELDMTVIAALQTQCIDVITFASSKTVRHACQLFEQGLGTDWLRCLDNVAVASIGPKTSETCRQLLGRVDIEATEYTLDGLTQAMERWASASLA